MFTCDRDMVHLSESKPRMRNNLAYFNPSPDNPVYGSTTSSQAYHLEVEPRSRPTRPGRSTSSPQAVTLAEVPKPWDSHPRRATGDDSRTRPITNLAAFQVSPQSPWRSHRLQGRPRKGGIPHEFQKLCKPVPKHRTACLSSLRNELWGAGSGHSRWLVVCLGKKTGN